MHIAPAVWPGRIHFEQPLSFERRGEALFFKPFRLQSS
jgi:hypothetical protein